jgi:ATP-binding cassette subfamily C exporter for protease/lipase
LLDAHPERPRIVATAIPSGAVRLSDVVARAPGRAAPLLDGVSLSVAAGTVTVVLGPSGSGKSTLARVLVGLWPCDSGSMLLDGLPIDHWSRCELGPHIGYLPQDVELFEGSIAENIARFGEVDAARVIEAARAAGLHETILRFPKGYDTPVGAEGGLLSGGQRQRIGLARALHGDPALVVLDEPNANLDDAGEAALLAAVQGCRERGRTVFLISHRPGIVEAADRLLILREGRVQIEGPREAVVAALKSAQPPAIHPAPLRPEPVSSPS